MYFKNREEAGKFLGEKLASLSLCDTIVLGLPRGGVVVAKEVAKVLNVPLNVFIVRKLGVPHHRELAMGAIAEEGESILDKETIRSYGLTRQQINRVIMEEEEELRRRIKLYRNGKKLPNLKGKTVILVDDGLATGMSAKVALTSIKKQKPKNIIFAAPICANQSIDQISKLSKVVCLTIPKDLIAIGSYYDNFRQITDYEVLELLEK
ncbi:phosphoribosyltransferase [Candidatus Curtissbacteria bacterium]|nr:phosphoribosyltransferase [Candidatus Curtissbacteria bacterium]